MSHSHSQHLTLSIPLSLLASHSFYSLPPQVKASLCALGTPSRLYCGLGPDVGAVVAANLGDATGGLPPDLRALMVYISPDRWGCFRVEQWG